MASALFSDDLTCSVCLSLFTDPVTLPCGHSFCRRCVTEALSAKHHCPLCQAVVSTEGTNLPSSHTLRSLAEKATEAERTRKEGGHEAAELCPEHEEKLKLFCVTDQQLACIICRDGERHEGHRFKPVKEAAAALRKELEANVEMLCGDILTTESLINKQRDEMRLNKERSQQLATQIHRQFEEMHQFLERREKEIKSELRIKEEDGDNKMSKVLKAMEAVLSESRELEANAASVLKIQDPERFLKGWTEGHMTTIKKSNLSRATKLEVVTLPLCLGPYESHLQFFVWKQMLQLIQRREEQQFSGFYSGQHYWEADVGHRVYWELGIKDYFLKYDDESYSSRCPNIIRQLALTVQPRKMGIYLSCSSLKLSFYDADTMAHIYTLTTGVLSLPVSTHINLKQRSADPEHWDDGRSRDEGWEDEKEF